MQSVEVDLSWQYEPLFRPDVPVRYYIITGGRGSGKSFAVATSISNDLVIPKETKNILYLRKTLVSAHVSIIPEFLEKIDLLGYGRFVESGKTEIENIKTGSKIYFRGIQSGSTSNEANLKSIPNIGTVIIDEAQELDDEATFDRLDLSLRSKTIRNRVILSLNPVDDTHWIYRRFFKERKVADDFNGIIEDTCYIHTDYRDNADNLSDDFLRLAEQCRNSDTDKYNHIWLGHWAKDKANALWKRATMIDPYRIPEAPANLERIVVAVDPAVTSKTSSDETGIIAAGCRRMNGATHYYIINDSSLKGSPKEWATVAINQYKNLRADRVIAEVNNGGDLVENTIRNIDRAVSYRSVRASRGKIVRAEPIAALYEQGLVHHVGHFGTLESQMCNYCGHDGEDSPDRMDALVWALTNLSSGCSSGVVT